MRIKKLVTVFTMFFALSLGSVAFAQVTPFKDATPIGVFPVQNVEQVSLLLSGFHEVGTKAQFEKVQNASDILVSIAKGKEGFVRDRAILVLARYWASADVYLLMASVISNPKTSFGTRLRMMVQFGDTFGGRSIPVLKHYLTDADPQVRISALQALQATNDDAAFVLIEGHAKTESAPIVLEAVKTYSSRIR